MTMPMPMPMPVPSPSTPSCGGRLVATDGRALPLLGTHLEVDARAGIARVVLRQTFENAHPDPLTVRYQVPLPADGAVSGFSFMLGETRVVGRVEPRREARAEFERAILEGRSAALLEQDRTSLFSQEVGNIPPGARVVCELVIDQRLRWLEEGRWEWRFPTVVAPRYLGAAGRVADGARVKVDVADGPIAPRAELRLGIRDELEGGRPESPSHALEVTREGRRTVARLREDAPLDRDVVVTWPAAVERVGAALELARPGAEHARQGNAFGLLTLVPPVAEAALEPVARDLVVLLDTSGSMDGEPIEQAKRITLALIDTLTERDTLELCEFSWRPRRWNMKPVAATPKHKREAVGWVQALSASGGTEMRDGIREAMRSLRGEAQRQIILVSDGLIGFESEIVAEIIETLPKNSRVHCVGVGSGVNRSLTGPAARAGRGVEVIAGIGEDVEPIAARLLARTDAPTVVELELSGSALRDHPAHLPDLFACCPALLPVRLDPRGGELVVRGRTAAGAWEERLRVEPIEEGAGPAGVVALYGREEVEDMEMRRAAGQLELDGDIERAGVAFQISTRMTSWVAISDAPTVDPRQPSRRETMPHELPHGMSASGLGLRSPAPGSYAMPMALIAGPMSAGTMTGILGRRLPGAPPPPASPAPTAAGGYAFDQPADFLEEDAADAATPVPARARRPAPMQEGIKRKAVPRAAAPVEPAPAEGTEEKPRGLVRRIADGVRRLFQAPTLRGRVVLRDEGTLVIEIELPTDLAWAPASAGIELANASIAARIDASLTTRAGKLAAGQVARLVLEWDGDGEPLAIVLVNGSDSLRIEL